MLCLSAKGVSIYIVGKTRKRSLLERLMRSYVFPVVGNHREKALTTEHFLRSRSYCVGSVGDMSIDAVLKYMELGQD